MRLSARWVSEWRQNARILLAAMMVFSSQALTVPCLFGATPSLTADPDTAEATVRMLFKALAERDLVAIEKLVSKDADMIAYSIGGRKYLGWRAFARATQEEFATVTRLEIPITDFHIWTRGPTAWYAIEVDYIRYSGSSKNQTRTVLPLRETGVLERRDGRWLVVLWHESLQSPNPALKRMDDSEDDSTGLSLTSLPTRVELSGE